MPNEPQPLGDALRQLGDTVPSVAVTRHPAVRAAVAAEAEDVATRARAMADRAAADPEPEGPPSWADDDLDAFEADDLIGEDGTYRMPEADADADQLLGVLARVRRSQAEIKATADRRRAKITEWETDRTARFEREALGMEARLEAYMRQVHERSTAKRPPQSIKLPHGTLSLTKARTRIYAMPSAPEWLAAASYGDELLAPEKARAVAKDAVAKLVADEKNWGPPADGGVAGADKGYVPHRVPVPGTDPADGEYVPGVFLLVPEVTHTFKASPS